MFHNYNFDPDRANYDENKDGLTLDEIIDGLLKYKEKYGGNYRPMMSYDGTGGYDLIRSIYTENFHDENILMFSSVRSDDYSECGDKPIEVFANNENGQHSGFFPKE